MSVVRNSAARMLKLLRRTPFHPQWLLPDNRAITEWVSELSRGQVLDIGCADRWIQPHLASDCRYIGLDYPGTGAKLYGAQPDVFADASLLPFQAASFDTVIMLEVLEHLRRPEAALREISRVTRPGASVLLSVPFLYPIHDAPHDYQRYTAHGLARELDDAGLQIEQLRPTLGSAESAGLVACLALGGMAVEAIKFHRPGMLLVPAIALLIPVINIGAWVTGLMLPSWPALGSGYQVTARRA
jgi:SAM-dependent methyltransferase